ncbi:ATP adenylyltransferase [Colletotrichum scovillei]|uniref:ATP adenylyltransferase n=1 Tax=Colletotrichum scovillei TaxID=1209932 RepID=A0A9P7U7T9_9PEZI|nr:ATP adenylyltransferase [Colletotrichum scovillei]KAF4773433.1 ATP adenylyltransferase [Colletotrichum scovillei]KAG7038645.1 ATP adenylyltransferase [Colletotrichum scovillei]KAG7040824.1 ATP adenylyltransferase [Colletotrichum scovillei]KAG7060869.1 ATP adenylyltransferase [Colletotrichum scovillei]
MASPITEASVLAAFDEKVRNGIVMYAEDMEKIYHEDGGFEFEFRLTAALKSKPAAVEDNAELDDADDGKGSSSQTPASAASHANTHTQDDDKHKNNKITLDEEGNLPGGDISIAGFELTTIGGGGDEEATHVLAFNKFCAYRPHLLLLTADGRRRQFEGLGERDLGAALQVLGGLNGRWGADADGEEQKGREYLVIFNCGKEGGCSRLHKHMQVIPAPVAIPMWPDLVASGSGTGTEAVGDGKQEPPFRYFIHRFTGPSPPSTKDLTAKYRDMLRQATELIPGREKVVEEDGEGRAVAVPHNVILGRRWIVVVPRVKAGVDGADVNAVGMLGVVWASRPETVGKWRELGARRVLEEVGVGR